MSELRQIALQDTGFAKATGGTIRLKLRTIGTLVELRVRPVKITMASACPAQEEFAIVFQALVRAVAVPAA